MSKQDNDKSGAVIAVACPVCILSLFGFLVALCAGLQTVTGVLAGVFLVSLIVWTGAVVDLIVNDVGREVHKHRLDDRAKNTGKRIGRWLDKKFPADDSEEDDD